MSEKDVVENVDSPGEIGIPIADNTTPGIASFDSKDFTVGPDGKVSSIVERGIPQYLGKITGTGTGTTDLNWEVDWKSRPTIGSGSTEEVDKAKRIKIGEYIMLTEHFNQFVPGDIFRITDVQIEGSKYTVKTNNVRALSLASIVGPQGEQGEEGVQGVPYLAYTNNIESTVDPTPGSIMRLEDGHFNRTPVTTSETYQDVVTVDWYNKTTHKAFMVTGYIQSKDSATNQWVALITAATDITGAVGPQGKEGAGIADIVDIDYPHGDFISVQYDTTDGIRMQGVAEYLRDDGETYQIPTDIDVPLVAGPGLSMDKKATEEKVEIKSLNSNLENGSGSGALQQIPFSFRYIIQPGAKAYGAGSQAFGRATKSYQCSSFSAGNSNKSGMTEEEFNTYYWDSANNVPLHNGYGKDDNGNILDSTGYTYDKSYSASATFGEANNTLGRAAFTSGQSNNNVGSSNHVSGKLNNVNGNIDAVMAENTNIIGNNNRIFSDNSFIRANKVFAAGDQLTGNYDNQIILGSLNKNSSKNIVEVGNGQIVQTDASINYNKPLYTIDKIVIKPYYPTQPASIYLTHIELVQQNGMAHSVSDISTYIELSGSQVLRTVEIGERTYTVVDNVVSSNPLVIKVFASTTDLQAIRLIYIALQNRSASGNYQNFGLFIRRNSVDTFAGTLVNSYTDSQSNVFEVLKDGRTKVKTAPIESDDVVRKQELDKKVDSTGLADTVYATNSSSQLTNVLYSKDALINSIAQRTANGRLKAADGVADDDLATVKQLNAVSGGEAVTPSTATSTATSGTFTSAEWAKLQANDNNYILFNNEIYRLADKAHSGTTGIWSYIHTGWDGTAIMDKSINVTVSTGAWTLVVGQESGGGKLYLHTVTVMKTVNDVPCYITLKGYSTSNAEVNTWEKLWSFFNLPTFQGGPGPTGISVGYLYWYYVGAGCSLFGNGQSSGPEGMTYVLSLYGSRYSRQTNAYEDMPNATSDDTSTYSWSSTDTTNPVTITDAVTDL